MLLNLQRLNVRNWLAEEVSNDHLLNVNKDTKPDVSLIRFYDSSVRKEEVRF